jgi:hypothetical protein
MRSCVDFLREPIQDGKCIPIARDGSEGLMGLGILDGKLEMKSLMAFLEVAMHQLGGASRIGVAYRADLDRDGGGGGSQELICHDARPGRGHPVETLIAGEVFERQKRDAFHWVASAGTSGACG